MIHLGDITKISGFDAPRVEVVIGGSPCQDLSVAGKRAGLKGERSGLFMEQIRIIKEMRERDRREGRTDSDVFPRFMVWENVPGAFSSNKGEDFRCVLEETARIADGDAVIPRPPGGKWKMQGASWEMGIPSDIGYSTRSFGECPRDGGGSLWSPTSMGWLPRKSCLSAILEAETDPKYDLSPKACRGILNRAARRGKALKEILRNALEAQAGV